MIGFVKALLLGAFFFLPQPMGGETLAEHIKNIATYEAQYQGVDAAIVLATLEAETNFTNKTGDSGNALGPGQVWPKWHNDAFITQANRFRLRWPDSHQERTNLVLSNDHFATAVATMVIARTWKAVNGDFRKFSEKYVGPRIPDSDYIRRLKIYQKYAGRNVVASSYTPGGSTDGNSSSDMGSSGLTASPINDVVLPETNYGVVANSQKYGNVLYGRKYRVLVSNGKGTALDVSDLRCAFSVYKTMMQPQFSTVTIFNLNAETENQIINEGDRVIVEAGYEGEQYGLIFVGDVVQPIRGKEDGVTYKLTLNSIDSDRALNFGFVGFSVAKGQTARDHVNQIAAKASIPTQLGSISEGLSSAKLTRGKVFFGATKDYLRQLSQSNAATFYMEDGKVNIIQAPDFLKDEIVDLSPESGLIGTPVQSDFGVKFKCLLNPRLRLNSLVRINNSQIQAQTFQVGQVPRALDAEGIYRIVELQNHGDTHSDDWYTEATCVSQAGGVIPGLMSSLSSNMWRG